MVHILYLVDFVVLTISLRACSFRPKVTTGVLDWWLWAHHRYAWVMTAQVRGLTLAQSPSPAPTGLQGPEAHKDGRKVEAWVLIVKNVLWLHTWPRICFYFWFYSYFFNCLHSWARVINVCSSLNHLSHLYTNKSFIILMMVFSFFLLIWKQSRIPLVFYHFHFSYLLLPWNPFQSTRCLRIWESRENPQNVISHRERPQPGTRYAESRRSPNTGSISPSGSDSVKPAQTSLHFSLHLLCKCSVYERDPCWDPRRRERSLNGLGGGGGGVAGWGCLHGPVRSLGGGVRHRVLHLRGRERRC